MSTILDEPIVLGAWNFTAQGGITFTPGPAMNPGIKPKVDLEKDVADTAAFLDEHILDWHKRVTQKIHMSSAYHCVLGQIFAREGEEAAFDEESGYVRGMVFLRNRQWAERRFVFTSEVAAPYWAREIDRRNG